MLRRRFCWLAAPAEDPTSPAGPSIEPEPCVGPSLILVFKPGKLTKTSEFINECRSLGIVASTLTFAESSPLFGYSVLSVAASAATLQHLAEEQALYKRLSPRLLDVDRRWKGSRDSAIRWGISVWCPFSIEQLSNFAQAEDMQTFFSASEVLRLLCNAVCTITSSANGHPVLLAAKATGEINDIMCVPDKEAIARLDAAWSPLLPWRVSRPDDAIVDYFGSGVMQYFVFMHEYARWLLVPAGLGGALFATGMVLEVRPGVAFSAKLTLAFTHFITVWAAVFVIHWRRLAMVNRHNAGKTRPFETRWTFESASHYFHSRGYQIRSGSLQQTGNSDPPHHYEASMLQTSVRYVLVVLTMLLMFLVIGTTVGILLWIGDRAETWTDNMILQNSPVLLYMVVIKFVQGFYDKLAMNLTHLEKHMLHWQFVRSLTIKQAAFQLINNLGFFVYVAFWKQDLEYLRTQLIMFFTVKQVLGNIFEVGLPWAQDAWHARRRRGAKPGRRSKPPLGQRHLMLGHKATLDNIDALSEDEQEALRIRVEREWQRPVAEIGEDYLEVAVLFAVTTWFAPVFPLGPLFALIHAVTEAWSDSHKLRNVMRRPVPEGRNEVVLEAWLDMFAIIGCCGIGVSFGMLAVFEDGLDRTLLAIGEHVVLFIWLYLYMSIPKEPEWLTQHKQNVESVLLIQRRSSEPHSH